MGVESERERERETERVTLKEQQRLDNDSSTVIYGYRIKYICRIGMWDLGQKQKYASA